ncbi:uncharacterized protein [Panulirus ornatus]|uniref:uncharacterized protein n=1 Tax=Panulirus ornatus TaxID=150431 RepID=UPI003A892F94
MSSSVSGPHESPVDLIRTLTKVRATLEGRTYNLLHSECAGRPDEHDIPHRDAGGNLDDVKEAFGACQTIEWKEQEYQYLKTKVTGHKNRDLVNGSITRLLGGSSLPAIHRVLLRSLSSPDAPQVEARGCKPLLRQRRASLALDCCDPQDSCGCGVRDVKARRRRSGVIMKERMPVESELNFLRRVPNPTCSNIISFAKCNSWASRESLLSSASRSLGSSDEDNTSVILNTGVIGDTCDTDPQGKGGVPRSVSEETLIYRHESPVDAVADGGAVESSGGTEPSGCEAQQATGDSPRCGSVTLACPTDDDPGGTKAATASVSSILDLIPHIDSSDDEDDDEDFRSRTIVDSDTLSRDTLTEKDVEDFCPECPPLCQPEEDLYGSGDDWQLAEARPAVVIECDPATDDEESCEDVMSTSRCPIQSEGQAAGARGVDQTPAVITGGVSREGWLTVEVLRWAHPDLAEWLARCCDSAHPCGVSPPAPRLLLVPAEALRTCTHLLRLLKEQTRAEVRVWVVPQSPAEASLSRDILGRADVQAEVISQDDLHRRVSRDQLSPQFGGTLELDPQAWLTFWELREVLLDSVRSCVSHIEGSGVLVPHPPPPAVPASSQSSPPQLQSSLPPPPPPSPSSSSSPPSPSSPKMLISSSVSPPPHSSPSSAPDLEELQRCVSSAKSALREMESCCQRLHTNILVRSWFTECRELVETVDSVLGVLLTHEQTRSSRHLQLYHEANSVVAWLLGRGEETLARHQTLADTLTGITRQETEFLKFFSVAMRHLEKGGSLLHEAASAGETDASVRELARALHLHLTQFTERLHHTRDRLEDTARCYHLLDKAYEWALEAMKVVGRVKGEGLASPEQVGAAARTLTAYMEEHPPIPEETFTAMTTLATRLNNHTLLQQCKMAQVRCQETNELLRSRQAVLQKAKRQMEFDCQSFVDLGEVFGGGEDMSPLAWLACSPLNVSGRRRSVSSVGSRPRESLSRCPSLDTDDDSVFLDPLPPPPPAKTPLEPRGSLGGIKEVRESAEDLQQSSTLPSPTTPKLTSPALGVTTSSSGSSGTSGSSSCSSSESSGPVTINKKYMKRANTWQFGLMSKEHADENSSMDDGVPLSPTSNKSIPPSSAVNSHLLIRGSQLNLSINTDDLSQEEVKKSKTLLLIMRELIQTERDYVNSLEYIIENYIPELMREDIPQALRGQRNVVFGNIEKIYEFHSGYFLRALEACEMRPFAVGSIFLRYESQFYLYALYNKNKPKSDSLMSEYGSSFFRKKQLELEDRMDLASYLLKPVQRMGKYALILKQLLKECSRGEENYDDLLGAQEMVQFQLRHGNDLLAMDSLRDCDVNLKEQGRLLRQGEFMVWEGSRAKKSIRHVFLFEDLILFSKARRDPEKKTLDIFQYKHSMKMTDIGLTEQVGVSTTKFEIWFRKRKPSDTYLLQAPNAEMKEAWTEEISKLLWRQALRNRTMRLHEMSSMGIGNKPCLDIRPSEDQISDRSISINQLNKAPRLRSGSTSAVPDLNGGVGKRPHSIISVSSSSASSSASSVSSHSSTVCPTYVGTLNLGFEPGDSPRALHRSVTRTSQCSAESGILADMYPGGDDDTQSHRRVERSNSTITTLSVDSALSPVSSASPVSPVAPTSPSLTTVSPTRPTDVIYEVPSMSPTAKDSSAKTLLTTEV